jgi:hypothetical protein
MKQTGFVHPLLRFNASCLMPLSIQAWPTTLDDFVAWKKAKTVGSEPTPPVEDEA